jgi:shikimate kinase
MSDDPSTRPILCLWGFMGTGKSTLGRALSEQVRLPFVDLDARIEAATGQSIAALFAVQGEAAFRAREAVELRGLLRRRERGVIALGGGSLLDDAVRAEALATAYVVSLVAPVATLLERVGANFRPLLGDDPASRLGELLERRRPFYRQAHASISSADSSPEAIVAALCGLWRGWN